MTDVSHQSTTPGRQSVAVQLALQPSKPIEIRANAKPSFFMLKDLGYEPDLSEVQRGIEKEEAMLHPSLEELKQSWRDGLTVVAIADGEVIGHLRLCPLLDAPLKQKLDLPKDFPEISETGSGWVREDYRDSGGIFTQMRYMLLESQIDVIRAGKLLVLGTTKHIAVIKGVRTSAARLELEFEFSRHLKYPFVAAFTCTCAGKLGTGMHTNLDCPKRTTDDQLVETLRKADMKRAVNNGSDGTQLPMVKNDDGAIMCTMYVSNKELTQRIDDHIRAMPEFGGNPMKLSGRLRAMGYYTLAPAQ